MFFWVVIVFDDCCHFVLSCYGVVAYGIDFGHNVDVQIWVLLGYCYGCTEFGFIVINDEYVVLDWVYRIMVGSLRVICKVRPLGSRRLLIGRGAIRW